MLVVLNVGDMLQARVNSDSSRVSGNPYAGISETFRKIASKPPCKGRLRLGSFQVRNSMLQVGRDSEDESIARPGVSDMS